MICRRVGRSPGTAFLPRLLKICIPFCGSSLDGVSSANLTLTWVCDPNFFRMFSGTVREPSGKIFAIHSISFIGQFTPVVLDKISS